MVYKKDIQLIFEEVIHKNFKIKCKPSYRNSTINAFKDKSREYNLKILPSDDKKVFMKFYDSKNNTQIIFTKDFINKGHIDLQDSNEKDINIGRLFEGYNNLPTKNKEDINELLFTVDDSYKDTGVKAWTHLLTEEGNHHLITIPDYAFDIHNTDNTMSYEYILAHESMHAHDFIKLNSEQLNNPSDYGNLDAGNPDSYRFTSSVFGEDGYLSKQDYLVARDLNDKYIGWLIGGGFNNYPSSDYGVRDEHEDYAEAGAMIITGWNNPDNPNSVTIKNKVPVQFREWVKTQPFKVKYILKEVYDKDVSIKEILDKGSWAPGEYEEFKKEYSEAESKGWLPEDLMGIF